MNIQKHCTFVAIENSIEIGRNGNKLGPKVTPHIGKVSFSVFLKYKIINAERYCIFNFIENF